MSFRFFQRKKRPYGWVDPNKATILPSAEAAWPIRGPGRTVEENLEGLRRMSRLHESVRRQQESG
jgi:hypothetical protein